MLVTLTPIFLSFSNENERSIIRLAASVNFSTGFTVPFLPFPEVINKWCDCFCCHLWYCYTIVDKHSLGFSIRFA